MKVKQRGKGQLSDRKSSAVNVFAKIERQKVKICFVHFVWTQKISLISTPINNKFFSLQKFMKHTRIHASYSRFLILFDRQELLPLVQQSIHKQHDHHNCKRASYPSPSTRLWEEGVRHRFGRRDRRETVAAELFTSRTDQHTTVQPSVRDPADSGKRIWLHKILISSSLSKCVYKPWNIENISRLTVTNGLSCRYSLDKLAYPAGALARLFCTIHLTSVPSSSCNRSLDLP